EDYFYDFAYNRTKSAFGVLDYDLNDDTRLTAGGSYRGTHGRPVDLGLPLLSNGEDSHLPRSTAYTFEWSFLETQIREGYLQLDHRFGADWRLQVDATLLNESASFATGSFIPPIDAVTRRIPLPPTARYSAGPNVM